MSKDKAIIFNIKDLDNEKLTLKLIIQSVSNKSKSAFFIIFLFNP